jgi:hypothetical protein
MSDISRAEEDAYSNYMSMNPYSDSFNPSAVIPEEAQIPGVMGMMTSPGFEQLMRATNPITLGGFAAFRTQNTLLQGGIGDDVGRIRGALRRNSKFSTFKKGSLSPTVPGGANQFVGGTNIFGRPTRRGNKLLARQAENIIKGEGTSSGIMKNFRKANLTFDPRRFFRKNSVTELLVGPGRNFYAPNQGGFLASIGNIKSKDNPRFSGGMLGRMGALTRTERRAARGLSTAKMDMNLARILAVNNQSLMQGPLVINGIRQLSDLGKSLTGAPGAESLTAGARRYAMAEGVRGRFSQSFMRSLLTVGGGEEMFTGMKTAAGRSVTFGTSSIAMTETAEKLMKPLTQAMHTNDAFRRRVANSLGMAVPRTEFAAAQMSKHLIQKGFIETLGYKGAAHAAAAGGGRVALAVGGQALLKAMPGLNMIFAADLAYQLAKLGGMGVKGAINFGKDAMKSMQGNINGGMFGTYKDDEVRATSRARGVMAIQNSRLNARSLLGSEGAMMAAHFG